jgi:autoinducer 2-degrading protein
MGIVVVNIRVSEGWEGDFIAATLENMGYSLKEPGITRFELLRDQGSPSRFILIEDYRDSEAQAAHKETAHYLKWKGIVEPMMAEPRTRVLYSTLSLDKKKKND